MPQSEVSTRREFFSRLAGRTATVAAAALTLSTDVFGQSADPERAAQLRAALDHAREVSSRMPGRYVILMPEGPNNVTLGPLKITRIADVEIAAQINAVPVHIIPMDPSIQSSTAMIYKNGQNSGDWPPSQLPAKLRELSREANMRADVRNSFGR